MRACITFVVALVSLLATSSAVLAATASTPTGLAQYASPGLIDKRQHHSVRSLRQHEDAKLDNEERASVSEFAKELFSKKQRYMNLFKKTNEELAKKNYGPDKLKNALKYLKENGVRKEKLAGFNDKADDWEGFWYRTSKLDPIRD
ncbi:hypothetical protein F441_02330 [Phytophthora nicotianae CJ01A1]|uniref:RxLR effector protein n=1 Tax=Phytophthora nicotianae CJ01A1 TaxID=1317063 RepID=W2XS30_PHYNI|nr:hypothetical protein F441_02330 [Phytophthora nicotianae CJ01A1]